MKSTKKQFYKSCFYWYADINISVDDFEKEFKQIYNNLKFKLYINDCKNDDEKMSYSLYLNTRCDKDLFNSIIEFIFKLTECKFNIFYKHLDNPESKSKYDYSYMIKVNKKPENKRWLFLDDNEE